MDAHLKLRDWWERTGANVPILPASTDAIDAIATRYDLSLPDDFYRYLAEASPAAENWDEMMGNWWPTANIKNIPDAYEHPLARLVPNEGRKFLLFLDHCMWCWAWAISCEAGPTFGKVLLIGAPDRFVADTFSEFVDRYIADWGSVC